MERNIWEYNPSTEIGNWELHSLIHSGYEALFIITDTNNISFISSSDDGVYRSIDEGITWELANLPKTGSDYYSGAIAPDNSLYVGSRPGIYRSTDQGETWKGINRSIYNSMITALCVPINGTVIAGTDDKGIYITTDNGTTWKTWGDLKGYVTSILTTSDGRVFVGTATGLYSCQLGATDWTQENLGDHEILAVTALALDKKGGLLVGTTSGLWKAILNTNAVHTLPNTSTSGIYPNPASTDATVSFQLEHNESVRLEVFDALGRSVLSLPTQLLNPGQSQYSINGKHIAKRSV